MQIYTLPDITPNGAVVNLAVEALANNMPTAAVFVTMTATGSSIRTGDANIGATRGAKLSNGSTTTPYPRQDNPQRPYPLSGINVYGGSGSDSVSITYGI